jgi:outer membrane protein TolC
MVRGITQGRETGAARLRFLGFTLAALAAGSALFGATPTLSLSLSQALQEALARSPEVHKAVLAVAQSQDDRRIAASALLPAVDGQASMTRMTYNEDVQLGKAVPGDILMGPISIGQMGVSVTAPLFDLTLYERWKAARHAEDGAKAQSRVERETIAALVVSQYLRSQRAAEAVKAADSRVELAAALEELARDQQKHGLSTSLDNLRAQVQHQNERQNLIQAQTQLKTAHYGLIKLLDLDPATTLDLTDPLSATAAPGFTFQEAFATGMKERPETTALEAREQAAASLKRAAQGLGIPSVVVGGSFANQGLFPHQPWVNTYVAYIAVKVPLFTGGRVSAQTSKAQAELEQVKEDRRELQARIGMEVQVAQAEVAAAGSEVVVATQAVALEQEAMTQARHRFEAGVSNNIEVINAQDELARAMDGRINALYRLNQSRADLAKAMGQLEPLFTH